MKARRRQNAIDNLNATSACADAVTDTVARCGPFLIKAETATSGRDINNAGLRCRCAAATGETGIAETGRAGTRFSSGAKGFWGI